MRNDALLSSKVASVVFMFCGCCVVLNFIHSTPVRYVGGFSDSYVFAHSQSIVGSTFVIVLRE